MQFTLVSRGMEIKVYKNEGKGTNIKGLKMET